MKKKFMMAALLLGVLSLGACIDDNESQSVTNVRNSKTAELKSIAAMEKAEAAAKVTLAKAEAQLNAAQVKAQQALAAKAAAEAEIETKRLELIELQKKAAELKNDAELIENQRQQAILDGELAKLEVTKEQNKELLAQIANEVALMEQNNQKALYEAQLQLAQAAEQLRQDEASLDQAKTDAERQAILAERAKLQQRADAYRNAVTELISAKTELNNLQAALVTLQTGRTTLQNAKDDAIAANKVTIAQNLVKIGIYKQYQNYQEEPEALAIKIADLVHENNKLVDINNAKWSAYANMEVNTEATEAADEEIEAMDFYKFVAAGGCVSGKCDRVDNDGSTSLATFTVYTLDSYVADNDEHDNAIILRTTGKKYRYDTEDGYYQTSISDTAYVNCAKLTADIRVVEVNVKSTLNDNTNWLEENNRNLKSAQSQYDGVPMVYEWDAATEKYVEKKIEGAVNAVKTTAAKKKLMDEATDEALKAQYKADYEQAIEAENTLKTNIVNTKNSIAYYTAYIKALNDGWKLYQEYDANVKTLQAKLDARNVADVKLHETKVAAWKEYCAANEDFLKVNTEYWAANTLYYGTNNGMIENNNPIDPIFRCTRNSARSMSGSTSATARNSTWCPTSCPPTPAVPWPTR